VILIKINYSDSNADIRDKILGSLFTIGGAFPFRCSLFSEILIVFFFYFFPSCM
jgi:hypothetical protein